MTFVGGVGGGGAGGVGGWGARDSNGSLLDLA